MQALIFMKEYLTEGELLLVLFHNSQNLAQRGEILTLTTKCQIRLYALTPGRTISYTPSYMCLSHIILDATAFQTF